MSIYAHDKVDVNVGELSSYGDLMPVKSITRANTFEKSCGHARYFGASCD